MPANPSPPTEAQRITASYALTLFILGATVGLMALLGRLAQELHVALLDRLALFGTGLAQPTPDDLAPLLRDLNAPGASLIVAGFITSTLCLLLGAIIWRFTGHPSTLREQIWMRFTHGVTLLLWISMGVVLLIDAPSVRIALLIVFGGVALMGLLAFVYLLVEYQFLASAPPLPDENGRD